MRKFNERLQHVATIKKKIQADLVADLSKNSAAVSRWWNGTVIPGNKSTMMLADYFGCNLEWLSTGEGEPFPENEKEIAIKTVRARAVVEHPYGPTSEEEEEQRFNQDLDGLFATIRRWQLEENGADSLTSMRFIQLFHERMPELGEWLKKRKGKNLQDGSLDIKSANGNG